MFKVRIKQAAKKAGVKNYYQLGLKLDFNKTGDIKYEALARRLWKGDNVPTLPTLDAICDALDCDFSDLVVRVKNGHKKKRRGNGNG